MREILFRGKQADGMWVYGDLIFDIAYHVDPSTIGQFTGLTDKNGKRIFEGDIVRHGYSNQNGSFFDNGTIAFVINDGAFEIVGAEPYTKRLTRKMIVERNIETIGNIHDNPELLP